MIVLICYILLYFLCVRKYDDHDAFYSNWLTTVMKFPLQCHFEAIIFTILHILLEIYSIIIIIITYIYMCVFNYIPFYDLWSSNPDITYCHYRMIIYIHVYIYIYILYTIRIWYMIYDISHIYLTYIPYIPSFNRPGFLLSKTS